jgi:hypothetical protein
VSTKTSLELVPCDGVDVCMGVAVRLPPVGYHSVELVRGKKDFLMIRVLGNHEHLLNSYKPIFGFHWVLGLGECGRASSLEFPKLGLRWWWLLLMLCLVVWLELIECLEHCLHQLVLLGQELLHLWIIVVSIVGLSIVGLTIAVIIPCVHHLRNIWRCINISESNRTPNHML